ncbi:MAG: hypothetical protein JEZ12_26170 [Desulfobacterium sp.]|nr:hypothetical protein [Desulfobacterium sp.]
MTVFNFGFGSTGGLDELKGNGWGNLDNLHEIALAAGGAAGVRVSDQFIDANSTDARPLVKDMYIVNQALLDLGANDVYVSGDLRIQSGRISCGGTLRVAGNVIIERTLGDESYQNVLDVNALEVGGDFRGEYVSNANLGNIKVAGNFSLTNTVGNFQITTLIAGGDVVFAGEIKKVFSIMAGGGVDMSGLTSDIFHCYSGPTTDAASLGGNCGDLSASRFVTNAGVAYGTFGEMKGHKGFEVLGGFLICCKGELKWGTAKIYLNGVGAKHDYSMKSGGHAANCLIYAGAGTPVIPLIEAAGGGGSGYLVTTTYYSGPGGRGGNLSVSANVTVTAYEVRGGYAGQSAAGKPLGAKGQDGVVDLALVLLEDMDPNRPALSEDTGLPTNSIEWEIPVDHNGDDLHFEVILDRVVYESKSLPLGSFLSTVSVNFSGAAPYPQGAGVVQFDLTGLGLEDGRQYQFRVRAFKAGDDTKTSIWSANRFFIKGV